MTGHDDTSALLEQIGALCAGRVGFAITGNGSKSFLTPSLFSAQTDPSETTTVSMTNHSGVINYQPTELVVKVRSGTPLVSLVQTLREQGQMLPFEPPVYAQNDTIGGAIACGMSGPRRPYAGSARDFVLGMGIINGRGQVLDFGGEVMKNVAGYDVSRLQVGAMGTLGAILDVSMKVLPLPETEVTLVHELDQANDCSGLVALARKPWPVSASAIIGKQQFLRLSGSDASVVAASRALGGQQIDHTDDPWQSMRDHQHPFFSSDESPPGTAIWRLSMADYVPLPALDGEWLIEWGGAQRWLKTRVPAAEIFKACEVVGGHATRYYGGDPAEPVFQPLQGPLLQLHSNVRDAFDPDRLINAGVYHPEI